MKRTIIQVIAEVRSGRRYQRVLASDGTVWHRSSKTHPDPHLPGYAHPDIPHRWAPWERDKEMSLSPLPQEKR